MTCLNFRGYVDAEGPMCELYDADGTVIRSYRVNPSMTQIQQVQQALKQEHTPSQTLEIVQGLLMPE